MRYRFLSLRAFQCLVLLAGCRQDPPEHAAQPPPKPRDPYATTLRFDQRYYDSLMGRPPYSARTLRQLAIFIQLDRLRTAKEIDSIYAAEHTPDTSVVRERETRGRPFGRGLVFDVYGPEKRFPNRAAQLIDIRRKIDSLEALERTSPTPR